MPLSFGNMLLRLKLIMLWLAVALGHLGHTTSHYLEINLHTAAPDESHDDHSSEHESDVCVTCIAFALLALDLTRSAVQRVESVRVVILTVKPSRKEQCGMEIAGRPGQARAPPLVA